MTTTTTTTTAAAATEEEEEGDDERWWWRWACCDLMRMERPTELKHITQWRKGKQQRLLQ